VSAHGAALDPAPGRAGIPGRAPDHGRRPVTPSRRTRCRCCGRAGWTSGCSTSPRCRRSRTPILGTCRCWCSIRRAAPARARPERGPRYRQGPGEPRSHRGGHAGGACVAHRAGRPVDRADQWKGLDSIGVTVVVLDSGFDATHPDFAGKIVASENFTDAPSIDDVTGHGTHVASIVGSGAESGGTCKGVARGAEARDRQGIAPGGPAGAGRAASVGCNPAGSGKSAAGLFFPRERRRGWLHVSRSVRS
jgi:hypothetical protein